ncbi:uncharacterized protein PV06_08118 [Exophiala oligosperma]|uniref:Uncharacterized protein n=2 Tax=Chaetothyriales TaxID=34395 RepID=A0A0D2D8W4_9EURO|nr:uncharacterized protein PV06_08118 [Exophiala oligosperma]KIW39513.1 hypothetical protein PV06_08118 [Exophiala oligosperma]
MSSPAWSTTYMMPSQSPPPPTTMESPAWSTGFLSPAAKQPDQRPPGAQEADLKYRCPSPPPPPPTEPFLRPGIAPYQPPPFGKGPEVPKKPAPKSILKKHPRMPQDPLAPPKKAKRVRFFYRIEFIKTTEELLEEKRREERDVERAAARRRKREVERQRRERAELSKQRRMQRARPR